MLMIMNNFLLHVQNTELKHIIILMCSDEEFDWKCSLNTGTEMCDLCRWVMYTYSLHKLSKEKQILIKLAQANHYTCLIVWSKR